MVADKYGKLHHHHYTHLYQLQPLQPSNRTDPTDLCDNNGNTLNASLQSTSSGDVSSGIMRRGSTRICYYDHRKQVITIIYNLFITLCDI